MSISRHELAQNLAADLTLAVQAAMPSALVFLSRVGLLPDGTEVAVPSVSASDSRVVPYAVVYPTPGAPSDETPLDDARGLDLEWTWQVTTAAGYPADHLRLVDVVTGFCDGWEPTVPDVVAGGARQVGDPGTQRCDETQVPPRWWLPFIYSQRITTA